MGVPSVTIFQIRYSLQEEKGRHFNPLLLCQPIPAWHGFIFVAKVFQGDATVPSEIPSATYVSGNHRSEGNVERDSSPAVGKAFIHTYVFIPSSTTDLPLGSPSESCRYVSTRTWVCECVNDVADVLISCYRLTGDVWKEGWKLQIWHALFPSCFRAEECFWLSKKCSWTTGCTQTQHDMNYIWTLQYCWILSVMLPRSHCFQTSLRGRVAFEFKRRPDQGVCKFGGQSLHTNTHVGDQHNKWNWRSCLERLPQFHLKTVLSWWVFLEFMTSGHVITLLVNRAIAPSSSLRLLCCYFLGILLSLHVRKGEPWQDLFELTNRIGRLSGFATRVRELMLGLQVRPPVLSEEIEAAKQGQKNTPIFPHSYCLKFLDGGGSRP